MEFVRGLYRTVQASFTRPADTNQYSAGDVVCDSTSAPTILTFTGATKDGLAGSSIIQSATITSSANQTTLPDLQLWLFDTAPAAVNDNAAFAPSDSELNKLIAIISFPQAQFVVANSASGASGNVVCNAQGLWLPFNTTAASNGSIFSQLVVRNAYTPVSGESFQIRLGMMD